MIRAKSKKTFGAAPKAPQFKKRIKAVEGEDLPALKNVMREIEGQHITVEDFLLLVAPHTGDKGAGLTQIMAEDLNAFRKLCNEAYDTMTKDTNEVMATTQIELGQLYAERTRLLTVDMIKFMKIIHDYIPDFSLEEYNKNPDKYLAGKFNVLDLPDETEVDAARRQLAFHRLNWLRAEGDRLSSENTKLQQRLSELKKIQQTEIADQVIKEREAEAQRNALETKEVEMQNQLEHLVDELHETIVNEEEKVTEERKDMAIKSILKKKKASAIQKSTVRKESKWSVKAAQEIEQTNIQEAAQTVATASTTALENRIKSKASSKYKGIESKYRAMRLAPKTTAAVAPPAEAVAGPSAKGKAGPATRRKKGKQPVPVSQRQDWQDVNVEEFVEGPRDLEPQPVDIFAAGSGRYTGGPPPRMPSPPRAAGATCTPSSNCAQRGSPVRAAPRQPSPPRQAGRRITGPRDSWGGFG